MSEAAVMATRFLQDRRGFAPAILRFEGPLYFMGPIWRIDWS